MAYNIKEYISLRTEREAAAQNALEKAREASVAKSLAELAKEDADKLSRDEFAARAQIQADERNALTARAVLAARGEDTTEADAALADYAEALGQFSAQYTRPTFEEAMAAARGE